MKKQFIFTLTILTALFITGCSSTNASPSNETDTSQPKENAVIEENTPLEETIDEESAAPTEEAAPSSDSETITLEEARKIALEDAGLSETDVHYLLEDLDYDDGKTVYDIEFYSGNQEYDYEIDAITGEIHEKDSDIENYEIPSDDTTAATEYITAEKAKEIALKKAGLTEKEVRFEKVERDEDDGKVVYELEFQNGKTEYDFEIDAITGDILDYDKDYDD